jgi:hypothetical protein
VQASLACASAALNAEEPRGKNVNKGEYSELKLMCEYQAHDSMQVDTIDNEIRQNNPVLVLSATTKIHVHVVKSGEGKLIG